MKSRRRTNLLAILAVVFMLGNGAWAADAVVNWNGATGKLSVSLPPNGHTVSIGYGPGYGADQYYLAVNGAANGYYWGQTNGVLTSDVQKIEVIGGNGSDVINLSDISTNTYYWNASLNFEIIINGNDGDDMLDGSRLGDVIYGGNGTDTINGRGGWDRIFSHDILVDGPPFPGFDGFAPGTPVNTPFKTISYGIKHATAGATICVRGGVTYQERVLIEGKAGTATNPIVIKGYNGTPEINGWTQSNWPDTGNLPGGGPLATADGLVEIRDCSYVTIQNIKVVRSHQCGISIVATSAVDMPGTDTILVENCQVAQTRSYGILAVGKPHNVRSEDIIPNVHEPVKNVTIRDNIVTEACMADAFEGAEDERFQGEGITVLHVDGFEIARNQVTHCHKDGIDTKVRVKNGSIHHNLVGPRGSSKYSPIGGIGIYVDASDSPAGTMGSIYVYDNFLRGNGVGICIAGERGGDVNAVTIYNNVVDTIGNCFCLTNNVAGSQTPGNRTNVVVYNNTFIQTSPPPLPTRQQFVANIREDVTEFSRINGFVFKNNIVVRKFDGDEMLFYIDPGTQYLTHANMTIDHNLYWDGELPDDARGVQGTPTVEGDPHLEDFPLTIAGTTVTCTAGIDQNASNAVDNGIHDIVTGGSAWDIRGQARENNAYDIGAYEAPY